MALTNCRTFTSIALISLLLLISSHAQDVTSGALATISVYSQPFYSSARKCAAACLVDNGIWVCGINGGYNDLGKALGCGCSPTNNCYCSSAYDSSVTSFMSYCVSSRCARTVGNWQAEAGTILGLYGAYCSTANIDLGSKATEIAAITPTAITPPAITPTANTPPGTGGSATDTARAGIAVTAEAGSSVAGIESAATSTAKADKEESKDEGALEKSDIVALAASLGVGIPSLLIAMVTLCVQIRKRKRRQEEGMVMPGHGAPMHYQGHPQREVAYYPKH